MRRIYKNSDPTKEKRGWRRGSEAPAGIIGMSRARIEGLINHPSERTQLQFSGP
jgi:hypothetical protein